jgi:PncC family amidohydrolase
LIKQFYIIRVAALNIDYIEKLLAGIFERDRLRKILITGSFPAVTISFPRDSFENNDIDSACEALESYCYSRGADSLEKVVLDLLRERRATLSVAESITGGLLASTIVSVPGASDVFMEGFITYSNKAKIRRLGVDAGVIGKYGAVNPEVCIQMAGGAASEAVVNYSLSTTGIAGPGGSTSGKDVGLCYIGLHSPRGVYCVKHQFGGNREDIRKKAVISALDLLRLDLEGYEKRLSLFIYNIPD